VKICYLTTDSLSEGVGKSQIVPLIRSLNSSGHEVSIVTMEKFLDRELEEDLSKDGIRWTALDFGRRGILSGFFRLIRLMMAIPSADVYHARSDISALAFIFMRKRPILWDVRSLWMEQRSVIAGGRFPFSLLNKLWRLVERFISRRSAAINTLALALQPALLERVGELPSIRTAIPTSVQLDTFCFEENLPSKKQVLLSGTFNSFYDRRLTESVMQTLSDQGYETKWCRPRESLDSLLSVTNLEVLEVKHEEMPAQIALASIGIAICRDDVGASLKGVMPTKVAEFLATGRPVIISRGMGDLDQFITGYRAGVLVDLETSEGDLIAAVEELLGDPDTPRRCRELAEEKFSMDKAVRGYLDTYKALITRAS